MPPDVPVSSVEPEDSVQTLSTRRNSSLLSASHHDLEKVSENLKDGKGVFMSDSAWLAIKTKTETQKSEPTTEAKSVELLQNDVDKLLVTVSFSLDEETIHQILQQSRSRDSLQCDGQMATCRSESVDVVS